jgi:hypothetical protein
MDVLLQTTTQIQEIPMLEDTELINQVQETQTVIDEVKTEIETTVIDATQQAAIENIATSNTQLVNAIESSDTKTQIKIANQTLDENFALGKRQREHSEDKDESKFGFVMTRARRRLATSLPQAQPTFETSQSIQFEPTSKAEAQATRVKKQKNKPKLAISPSEQEIKFQTEEQKEVTEVAQQSIKLTEQAVAEETKVQEDIQESPVAPRSVCKLLLDKKDWKRVSGVANEEECENRSDKDWTYQWARTSEGGACGCYRKPIVSRVQLMRKSSRLKELREGLLAKQQLEQMKTALRAKKANK